MISAVVFDIGNVLLEWHPEDYFDKHFGPKRREAFFRDVNLKQINDRSDSGESLAALLIEAEAQHPDYKMELRAWKDDWIQLASPIIPHSVHLLRTLKSKRIPVFSLSNFGVETFEYAASMYSFLGEFDRNYISGHMGVMKPRPRIFEMVEADCGIPKDRLLFTDDRVDNIAQARARGWQTHHFTDPAHFADCLVRHGLLTKSEACR